eukprot:1977867-Pyramimonas_sp.AAC.1
MVQFIAQKRIVADTDPMEVLYYNFSRRHVIEVIEHPLPSAYSHLALELAIGVDDQRGQVRYSAGIHHSLSQLG